MVISWNSEDAVVAPPASTNSLLFVDIDTLDLHLGSDIYSKYGIVDRCKGRGLWGRAISICRQFLALVRHPLSLSRPSGGVSTSEMNHASPSRDQVLRERAVPVIQPIFIPQWSSSGT